MSHPAYTEEFRNDSLVYFGFTVNLVLTKSLLSQWNYGKARSDTSVSIVSVEHNSFKLYCEQELKKN